MPSVSSNQKVRDTWNRGPATTLPEQKKQMLPMVLWPSHRVRATEFRDQRALAAHVMLAARCCAHWTCRRADAGHNSNRWIAISLTLPFDSVGAARDGDDARPHGCCDRVSHRIETSLLVMPVTPCTYSTPWLRPARKQVHVSSVQHHEIQRLLHSSRTKMASTSTATSQQPSS